MTSVSERISTARTRTAEHQNTVRTLISAFLDEQDTRLGELNPGHRSRYGLPWQEQLFDSLRNLLSGGKLLRPAFCYWGWRAAGGEPGDEQNVVRVAASLELLHLFALVHDDIMDQSATRRGTATVHHHMANVHRSRGWRGSSTRFGTSAAILVGDLCLVWSYQLLLDSSVAPPAKEALVRSAHRGNLELMAGQYLDLLYEVQEASCLDDAMMVNRYKTAKYTVERPLRAGATLVDPRSPLLPTFTKYAALVGDAFQLRDDLLGIFGDPATTGKPVTDDIRSGKHTVLTSLARGKASASQLRDMNELLGTDPVSPRDVARLKAILLDTGAVAEVEEMIAHQVRQAHDLLDAADLDVEARDGLSELIIAATSRRA